MQAAVWNERRQAPARLRPSLGRWPRRPSAEAQRGRWSAADVPRRWALAPPVGAQAPARLPAGSSARQALQTAGPPSQGPQPETSWSRPPWRAARVSQAWVHPRRHPSPPCAVGARVSAWAQVQGRPRPQPRSRRPCSRAADAASGPSRVSQFQPVWKEISPRGSQLTRAPRDAKEERPDPVARPRRFRDRQFFNR